MMRLLIPTMISTAAMLLVNPAAAQTPTHSATQGVFAVSLHETELEFAADTPIRLRPLGVEVSLVPLLSDPTRDWYAFGGIHAAFQPAYELGTADFGLHLETRLDGELRRRFVASGRSWWLVNAGVSLDDTLARRDPGLSLSPSLRTGLMFDLTERLGLGATVEGGYRHGLSGAPSSPFLNVGAGFTFQF